MKKKCRLNNLRPFEQNPRLITEEQVAKLKRSLIEDGYHNRLKVTPDLRVIGGHQRLKVMKDLGWDEIAVLVPDRALSDDEFIRVMLRDNHNNGTWDMEALANMFDLEFLRQDIGLHDVMNIPPLTQEDSAPGKNMVCCPQCGNTFPVKGNKANG